MRYRLTPLAALLPFRLLEWLHRNLPVGVDPADGWSFWTEAHYWKYCWSDNVDDEALDDAPETHPDELVEIAQQIWWTEASTQERENYLRKAKEVADA